MGKYVTDWETGQGMSLSGRLDIRPTIRAVVKFDEDGKIAWGGPSYFSDGLTGRQKNGLRLQASKMLRRYQHHYETTGKRFEIEREEERRAKDKAHAVETAIKRAKREAALDLYDALEYLIQLADPNVSPDAPQAIAQAKAAKAKADEYQQHIPEKYR